MKLKYILALMMLIVLSACSVKPDFPLRALVGPQQVIAAISLEKELNTRENMAIPDGKKWFEVVQGTIPVIVTAPHATRPLRNGKRRFADGGGTAALAVTLGELTGAYVIYSSYEGPSDPNYYDDNQFKEQLADLIREVKPAYILDLHASHPYRSFDVDLGTMNGESLMGNDSLLFKLIEQLQKEGIVSISYNRFSAAKNATLTKFSLKHGVPAIQMEINATYATPSQGSIEAHRFSKLVQALARFIGPREAGLKK